MAKGRIHPAVGGHDQYTLLRVAVAFPRQGGIVRIVAAAFDKQPCANDVFSGDHAPILTIRVGLRRFAYRPESSAKNEKQKHPARNQNPI